MERNGSRADIAKCINTEVRTKSSEYDNNLK